MTSKLVAAAEAKFGAVLMTAVHLQGGTVLMIERAEPAKDSLPYMTIRGYESTSGAVSFEHGHYDLSRIDAEKDFHRRAEGHTAGFNATSIFDCPKCGRHYDDEDITDVLKEFERTGYCFDGCQEENEAA